MYIKTKILIFIFLFLSTWSFAVGVDCINTPTAEVVDYGVGEFNVRVYSGGGVIVRLIFSPFNRLNFGGSVDIERLIGCDTPELHDPVFYFKWKIFDGTTMFPAVGLGYDGQGYNFSNDSYTFPAKGVFLAFSNNILLDKLFVDYGFNITRYKEKTRTFGFVAMRFIFEDILNLTAELENIGELDVQRINLRLGVILAKIVSVDMLFVNLEKGFQKIERQVRINYQYKFL